VLVALRAAGEGRLVYLEEPEIDLHPLAQTKLADVLAGAAKRGVRAVVETHSSLLLRAIQTSVAKGDLAPELVRLHWFSRDRDGVTQVNSAKLDANGAFGDWPEDFGDVALESEKEYLDAVEDRLTH
jgi:predicted ATPase